VTSSAGFLAVLSLLVATASALVVSAGGVAYLRRVRLERPPIGTFNGRDVVVLFVPLSLIPLFYLSLPRWLLTAFLVLTFCAALSIGLRPLLAPGRMWLLIGGLLGLNLWLGANLLGTVLGWQVFWVENDLVVLLAAVFVANLYVQGGMRLSHVAWFALALAAYDLVFTSAFPLTNALVEEFLGYPLDPSVGMRWGFDNAAIGIGDLLVYGLFVLAAYKGYGPAAARLATAVVLVFGAAAPALVPLLVDYVDARTDTLVPAQFWFGPAAFLTWVWLRYRHGRERTVREFLDSDDVARPRAPAPDDPAEGAAGPDRDGTGSRPPRPAAVPVLSSAARRSPAR
jgi:hypothetical protein